MVSVYFADWQGLDEVHDCLSVGGDSVLAVGLVFVTAHLGNHRVWSNAWKQETTVLKAHDS